MDFPIPQKRRKTYQKNIDTVLIWFKHFHPLEFRMNSILTIIKKKHK